MKKLKISRDDISLVQQYLIDNSNKPINVVFHELEEKKFSERTKAEKLVYIYLFLHKKSLGIK